MTMIENGQEKQPEYSLQDFQLEAGKKFLSQNPEYQREAPRYGANASSVFLNNIHLNLPLKEGKGAMHTDMSENRIKWSKPTDLSPRAMEMLRVIKNYCTEKGMDFGEQNAQDISKNMQPFLIDLYINLQNMGFVHEEITR